LLSRDLFRAYRNFAPKFGERGPGFLGGELFEINCHNPPDQGVRVAAWISPTEVIVSYLGPCEREEKHSLFRGSIDHLRNSEPLELGRIRIDAASSYGATFVERVDSRPRVMWAQYGDWAALARNWLLCGHSLERC
jgi:hypothetical protein